MGKTISLTSEKLDRMNETEFLDWLRHLSNPDPMENAVRDDEKYFLYRKAICLLRKYSEKWRIDVQDPNEEDISHVVSIEIPDSYEMRSEELKTFSEIVGMFDNMILEKGLTHDGIDVDLFMHEIYKETD